MNKLELLKSIEIGKRIAEEESDELTKYFVKTSQWEQILQGKIDIVYGAKGTGKSALYALLNKHEGDLFDNSILLASAENVRGTTVFKGLVSDPPPTEYSFIFLWKLYCLTIIAKTLREYKVKNSYTDSLVSALEESKLLPVAATPASMFRSVMNYFKGWMNRDVSAIEHGISLDPATGMPVATRKVEFREANDQKNLEEIPVDELLEIADKALISEKLNMWVLFDRLDVAFADSKELERNALRALFRAYNDMRSLHNVALKIFVRDDIWNRISSGGFAEASHITKTSNILWARDGLLNIIMLRLLSNDVLVKYLTLDKDSVINNFGLQKELMASLLPDKIDTGKNPETFDWMISRTTDGLGKTAPRELIHLFECVKDLQIKKLERGENEPPGTQLFDRSVFKEALEIVSKVRLEQTIYAEYPEVKPFVIKLENEKSEQTIDSLVELWTIDEKKCFDITEELVAIGFFEKRGEKSNPTFWVPFLYRGGLDLVQGKAL